MTSGSVPFLASQVMKLAVMMMVCLQVLIV